MSSYQYQPPTPAPKKRGRKALIACLIALVLCAAGGTVVALFVGAVDPNTPTPGARRALAATSTASPTGSGIGAADSPTTAAAAVEEDQLTASAITLKVKITSQHCFGSAGCNLEVEVRAGWPDTATGTYDVTYRIAVPGGDDITDTLTVYAETGKYDAPSTAFVSASHRVSKLTAKVTDVEAV